MGILQFSIWAALCASMTYGQHCPSGETVWCEHPCQKLVEAGASLASISGSSAADCKQRCLSELTCRSINYADSGCDLHTVKMGEGNAQLEEARGFTYYDYVCSPATCPEPEPEPECADSEPEPEGEAEVTPEEFWRWLRDEPQWFALIGMGVVVILMLIIIIVLICRLKQQSK